VGCTVLERGRGEPAEPIRDSRRKAAESPLVAVSHWKRPAGLTGPGLLTYPNVPKVPKVDKNMAGKGLTFFDISRLAAFGARGSAPPAPRTPLTAAASATACPSPATMPATTSNLRAAVAPRRRAVPHHGTTRAQDTCPQSAGRRDGSCRYLSWPEGEPRSGVLGSQAFAQQLHRILGHQRALG